MIVKDNGHHYLLDYLDNLDANKSYFGELIYVKREGPGYPGNIGHHQGTTLQEVCRAQIHRALFVNQQLPSNYTKEFIKLQRRSIFELEQRAAERHGSMLDELSLKDDIENEPTCVKCGHIQCTGSCRG